MVSVVGGAVLGLLGGRVFWWIGALLGAGLGLAFSVVADGILDRLAPTRARWWVDKNGMMLFGMVGAGIGWVGLPVGLGLFIGPLCTVVAGLVAAASLIHLWSSRTDALRARRSGEGGL